MYPRAASAAPSNARTAAATRVRARLTDGETCIPALPHRPAPPGKNDERSILYQTGFGHGPGLISKCRASVLEHVIRRVPLHVSELQRLTLELGQGGAARKLQIDLVPGVLHHHPYRQRTVHATWSAGSGRVERKRSTTWSKSRVDIRTRVPLESGHTASAISSPPCPRRVTNLGPSFSG